MRNAQTTMRLHLRFAFFWTALLGGTAVAWSMMAPLDGAVVSQGTLTVESNVKKVQHPTGGVVGQIHVREGQRVREGEVLVRLDETAARANLGVTLNELTAMRLRQARLIADRDGNAELEVPADIATRAAGEPELRQVIAGERQLHRSRMTTRQGQKAQLAERIGQQRQEIAALAEQRRSTEIQLKIAKAEFADLRDLQLKGLVQKQRVTALEREIARNDGVIGELAARVSQTQGRIAETELQILQLEKDAATEVAKELREVETKIGELNERRISAEDQLRRVDMRAPIDGIVHHLNVHTIGGVINPTEPLMLIVPQTDRLLVEVRINPQDIDQVHVGQAARVRFAAFNQRTTPELQGEVLRVAADLTREPQTGVGYYVGAVAIGEAELARLKGLRLIAGMPAEAYIKTGERTFASYLLKPLGDQIERGLRER
ncbi:MAG TPA: HlyD family type I secretion periplasmic adaptor subunit [Vineibacter sp.]|nr:HlyD family type I secretion periplasmic adaptor subunit [Vineibacter sp.]